MSEQVICSKCKEPFTKTLQPSKGQNYYKTCETCRRGKKSAVTKKNNKNQNTTIVDWKSIVFGKPTPPKNNDDNSSIIDSINSCHNVSLDSSSSDNESEVKSQISNLSRNTGLDAITYVDTVEEPIIINESPIVTNADDDSKPISIDDLQKEIVAKHENTVYVPVEMSSNDKHKEPTVTDKLNTIIKLIESTDKKISNQADGYNTSTKILLEKINSNVIRSSTPYCNDNEFNAYEVKLDKIVCRVSELENNLKFLISNVMDAHRLSSDKLKQAFEELSQRI